MDDAIELAEGAVGSRPHPHDEVLVVPHARPLAEGPAPPVLRRVGRIAGVRGIQVTWVVVDGREVAVQVIDVVRPGDLILLQNASLVEDPDFPWDPQLLGQLLVKRILDPTKPNPATPSAPECKRVCSTSFCMLARIIMHTPTRGHEHERKLAELRMRSKVGRDGTHRVIFPMC